MEQKINDINDDLATNKNKITVKYANYLNTVILNNLEQKEIDLFFYFCAKLKEQGAKTVSFQFSELKKVIEFSSRDKKRFSNLIDNLFLKMSSFCFDDGKVIDRMFLFSKYKIDREQEITEVKISEEFLPILNNLVDKRYTIFYHQELVKITSSYGKMCYRLLKQYRSTGYMKITVEKLKKLLQIPMSYRVSDINKHVISIIETQLSPYFSNFKIKEGKTRSPRMKTTYYEFFFKKELIKEKEELITHKETKQILEISNDFKFDFKNNTQINVIDYPNDGKMSQEEIRKILEEFDNH